ncbi:energy transducer TonB [Myxococcota bacterium]|nr:energy transducer TonB [Myxococcota bacterium]
MVIAVLGWGCGDPGSRFTGRWVCADRDDEWLEITANGKSFLVEDEDGKQYVAVLQDDVLSIQAGGLVGAAALVIEDSSGDLLCPGQCSCKRLRPAAGKAKEGAAFRAEMDRICHAGGPKGPSTTPEHRDEVLKALRAMQTQVRSPEAKKVLEGLALGRLGREALRSEAVRAGLTECTLIERLEASVPTEVIEDLNPISEDEPLIEVEFTAPPPPPPLPPRPARSEEASVGLRPKEREVRQAPVPPDRVASPPPVTTGPPEVRPNEDPSTIVDIARGNLRCIYSRAPEYPPLARKQGTTGSVVVQVIIGLDGRVESAEVAGQSPPIFHEAALTAARKTVCEPYRSGNVVSRARMRIQYHFKLR